MRLSKMLGMAVTAGVIMAAVIGTSSAMAGYTALCKVNELPCAVANQVSVLQMAKSSGTVLSVEATGGIELTALCLNVSFKGEVLGLGSGGNGLSQSIHTTELNYANCGTNASHNNCFTSTVKLPLFELLKTAPNLGQLTALSGKILVFCSLFGFTVLHCVYDLTGLTFPFEGALHSAGTGHGMWTASGIVFPVLDGSFFCPVTTRVSFLMEPTSHTWISS